MREPQSPLSRDICGEHSGEIEDLKVEGLLKQSLLRLPKSQIGTNLISNYL